MSKEEFLKIQTCVLKVNIHCDGCKQKVKKILQKIDGNHCIQELLLEKPEKGVYTISIDSEQGKVTVSGDIDPVILIKKLTKNGKHAELWGASNTNNNLQSQLNDQLKALQIEQAKCRNTKGQNQKGGNNQLKGGPPEGQLQQLRQMKGFQDLKMPPQFMKDLKMPLNKEQNQKSVRFNLPAEDEDLSDDDDEDEKDDEELDDDCIEDAPLNKMKPMIDSGQGGPQIQKMLMSNMTGGNIGGNGGGIAKGGGGVGNTPVQMNVGSGGRNGGNKGNNRNNHVSDQNQGGGKGGKNGGGGGGSVVVGGGGGGGQSMISGAGSGGRGGGVANGNNITENMMGMNAGGSLPVGPTGQINNLAAVQSLRTSAMNTSGGGYFQGGPLPEHLSRNQQQLAAMMMNQQQANGDERFQPMMYTLPPPAVNYMPPPYPPYPYPYPYPYAYAMYNDENTSLICSVM